MLYLIKWSLITLISQKNDKGDSFNNYIFDDGVSVASKEKKNHLTSVRNKNTAS